MQFKIFIKKKKKLFIILRKISIYFYPNQLLNPLSNSNLSTKATVFFLLINYYIFIFHNKIIQNLDKHESRMPKSLRHSERTIAKETLLLRIQLLWNNNNNNNSRIQVWISLPNASDDRLEGIGPAGSLVTATKMWA